MNKFNIMRRNMDSMKINGEEAALRLVSGFSSVSLSHDSSPIQALFSPQVLRFLGEEGRRSMEEGRERGGWLLGRRESEGEPGWVVAAVPGPVTSGSISSYRFDLPTLSRLLDGEDEVAGRLKSQGMPHHRVGWYHTHPGYGVFLSAPDREVHRVYFSFPGGLAVVIAPEVDCLLDAFGVYGSSVDGGVHPLRGVGLWVPLEEETEVGAFPRFVVGREGE